jgi:DNA repair protein RecO (recombination protein O)
VIHRDEALPVFMIHFRTPGILIRRTEYGESDLIVTFFTLARGKLSLIAKAAKKSTRRFAGVLELFSEVNLVGAAGRQRGLPVLQEAALTHPFGQIRAVPTRIAYASYWAELIDAWMEEQVEQPELYHLLHHGLTQLDHGDTSEAVLSILFQMRFLRLSGHSPNLERCGICQREVDAIRPNTIAMEVGKGGIACLGCLPRSTDAPHMSKGAVKQLRWMAGGDLARAARIRFSPSAVVEALEFLERFVPYHLGRQPRSLKVLRQLRGNGA